MGKSVKWLMYKRRWFLMTGLLLAIIAVALCMIQVFYSRRENPWVPNWIERTKTSRTVKFINENSKLPVPLLAKDYDWVCESLEQQFGTENVEDIFNYMSLDLGLSDESLFVSFTGYPEDRDKYILVEEIIKEIDRGYHVLGITVGSSYEKATAVLEANGFQTGDSYNTYSKGEVEFILEKDDAGVVTSVGVRVKTYYTSGVTY